MANADRTRSRRRRHNKDGLQDAAEEADDESGPLHGPKRSRDNRSRSALQRFSGIPQVEEDDDEGPSKLATDKFEALFSDPLMPAGTDDSCGPPRKKSRTSPETMDYSTSGFVPREDSQVREAREGMDSMDLD